MAATGGASRVEVEVQISSSENMETAVIRTNQAGKHVLIDLAEKINASGGLHSDVSVRVIHNGEVLVDLPTRLVQKLPTPDPAKVAEQAEVYNWAMRRVYSDADLPGMTPTEFEQFYQHEH